MITKRSIQTKKFSIRFTVGTMFIIATILTAAFGISLQYHFSKQAALEQALQEINMVSEEISDYMAQLDSDAARTVNLLSQLFQVEREGLADDEKMRIFSQALIDTPHFYSLYLGNDNDNFYQIINLDSSPIVRRKINADSRDRWVVIKIYNSEEGRVRETCYYSEQLELNRQIREESNFYPSQRPWFQPADQLALSKTNPYLFQHLKITGQTYAKRIPDSHLVLGLDIVLSSLSAHITSSHPVFEQGMGTELFIFSDNGNIISSNLDSSKELETLVAPPEPLQLTDIQRETVRRSRSLKVSNQNDSAPIDFAAAGEPRGYAVDLLRQVSAMTGLKFEFINGFDRMGLVERFEQGSLDVLHSVQRSGDGERDGLYSLPLYQLPHAIVVSKEVIRPDPLARDTATRVGVVAGWSLLPEHSKRFPWIHWVEYASVEQLLRALADSKVDIALAIEPVLQQALKQFNSTTLVLHDQDPLLLDIPKTFHLVMHSQDAEIVKIINLALNNFSLEQRVALESKWFDAVGSANHHHMKVPYPSVLSEAAKVSSHHKMLQVRLDDQPNYLFVNDVGGVIDSREYFAVVVPDDVLTAQITNKVIGTLVISVLIMVAAVPLVWIFVTPIVNPIRQLRDQARKIKRRDFEQVRVINTRIKEVSDLSTAFADMAHEIKLREDDQEAFVEAFIQLIAQAIDDKSAYTAGHCNRVPELGLMLAEAAERSTSEPFKEFSFLNDDERREFRIAAWLHDCGKITTPEDIVDKGTKLECIYNRIHEVRMRFEVLWRDAEIAYLHAMMEPDADEKRCQLLLRERQQQLQDDFAFVASANVGGEFISDEHVARLQQIGQQVWTRYFDDQLGLSPIEEARDSQPAPSLPTQEKLLVDKPSHITKRTREVRFDSTLGIKIEPPEYHANRGELYNLSIGRGTLTKEDRYRINEHMISTIKMLDNLPFPPELSRVPRYASSHHETLKGTGYPRKLDASSLSIPERILAVADIFEALTAADRPYKKAKPLSVAIDIMYHMALDEHIDIALFRLFLESGIHLSYAEKFLPMSQRDTVQIEKYLQPSQPTASKTEALAGV